MVPPFRRHKCATKKIVDTGNFLRMIGTAAHNNTEATMDEAQLERDAEQIYLGYSRKELFPEFLEHYSGAIKGDNPLLSAVQQRDYEAVGGLLCAAFEEYLSECAEYDAKRIQGW
jgi:hypothetical protein